jgi:pimeloyl-ACP methyl ester carboxylesterase
MRALRLLVAVMTLSASPVAANVTGHWEGAMVAQGQSVPVAFDFASGTGRFTSQTQFVMDYSLDSVDEKDDKVDFVVGGGLKFSGSTSADTIQGSFAGGDTPGRFTLHRVPAPVLPYGTHDLAIRDGDVSLSATIAVPRGKGRFPAVVLLGGSGPQTRWGTLRALADRYAREGVAALVYDKRGCGESTGDWRTASYQDLASDALAGVAALAARSDIDAAHIGVRGHSEGGIVAPVAATLAPGKVAFVVAEDTVAGLPRDQDVYRVQTALAGESFAPADKAKALDIYRLFVDVARRARPYADLEAASRPYLQADWYQWLGIPPRGTWIWS